MPRKTPFSGKQKKKQLQEKKTRKQTGPKYLQGSGSEEDDDEEVPVRLADQDEKTTTEAGAESDPPHRAVSGIPEVQRINLQPQQRESSGLDANSFRLHFFKQDEQTLNKGKKEARKAIKPISTEHREWALEDVYPAGAKLDFPKRPSWRYTDSKDEVERNEQRYFKDYVQDILDQRRAQDLSFFELNLETWRQLWRVLEMSDILLIIADIRYPVLHIPPRLLTHVMTELKKWVVVVLNKVDLVSPVLVLAWKRYLEERFPGLHVVFFSSNPREVSADDRIDPSSVLRKRPFRTQTLPVGPEELYKTIKVLVGDSVDLSSWEQRLQEIGPEAQHDAGRGGDNESSTRENPKQSVLTIGCVGYPNAGKSTVLNSLVGKKVVSVSKTPGHTKHFQTIFLTPNVRLCDCPGLVFPSLVPKSLQVLAGIFPVSQVREPYSVVAYLAKRLDLPKLLNIKPPRASPRKKGGGGDEDVFQWSTYDICEAWAMKCGFMTSKAGRPDMYRAANKILRLAVEGQLCLCFFPPGFSANRESLASDPETDRVAQSFCGKTRRQGTTGQGSLVEEEEEEDDESSNSGSESGEPEKLESLGMFDQLRIQDDDEADLADDT